MRLWAYSSAVPVWWSSMEGKLSRLSNLEVWQVPAETSKALAALAQRSMQLQVTVQDGAIWVGDGKDSVQVEPIALRSLSQRRG